MKSAKYIVVAVAIVSGGTAITAGVSHAAIKNGVCQTGEVCYWDGTGFSGGLYDNNDGNDGKLSDNYFIVTPAISVDNKVSSIRNLGSGGKGMKLYDNNYQSGFLTCAPYGTEYTDLLAASNKTQSNAKASNSGCA